MKIEVVVQSLAGEQILFGIHLLPKQDVKKFV